MTTDKAPFSFSWIVTHAIGSISAPKEEARTIIGLGLPTALLWQALLLIVVVSVVLGQLVVLLIPMPGEPGDMMGISPFAMVGLQVVSLGGMALAVHLIGRLMGGSGDFAGALAVVTWLQIVLVGVQIIQIVAMLLLPVLAPLAVWLAIVLFLWLLTNFVAVLHGFRSLGLVFVMILMSALGIAFVFNLVLMTLGVIPPGGFNV
jgi:hypothetical protein